MKPLQLPTQPKIRTKAETNVGEADSPTGTGKETGQPAPTGVEVRDPPAHIGTKEVTDPPAPGQRTMDDQLANTIRIKKRRKLDSGQKDNMVPV